MSEGDLTFPPSVRILKKPEFDLVFREGRSWSDDRLIVYARPRGEGEPSRLGLVVGRKFGGAVERNTFKRRIREAFRLNRDALPKEHDLVVLPRAPGLSFGAEEAVESLVAVARGAARTYARRGPRT